MSTHDDPLPRLIARLVAGGFDPRPTGPDAYESRCPGHDGSRHNLAIARGDNGGVLVHCHHMPSCSTEDILAPLGLEVRDLFGGDAGEWKEMVGNGRKRGLEANGTAPHAKAAKKKAKTVHPSRERAREAVLWGLHRSNPEWAYAREWEYHAADGAIAAVVCRFELPDGRGGRDKSYAPIHPESGGWVTGGPARPWPLYGLVSIRTDPDVAVYFVEGEKCADALRDRHLIATTTMHGARSPQHSDLSPLAGRDVVILPDHDDEGRLYAERVVELLQRLDPPARVKIVPMPLEHKGDDVADWLAAGGTVEVLQDLVAAVPWRERTAAGPTAEVPPAGPQANGHVERRPRRPRFANYRTVRRGTGTTLEPLSQEQLDATLAELAPGWPKRVGLDQTLFLVDGEMVVYLDKPDRLYAWLDATAAVDWTRGGGYISQSRYFEHLRMSVEHFEAIESLPHFPPIAKLYYCHRTITPAANGTLDRMIDHFRPHTPTDRELIRAMILTTVWGGPVGSRPAFLVTGPEVDGAGGRGVGKSRFVDCVCRLLGGAIDVTPTDAIADVKTRMLSDAARQSRVARLDNVKSLKFSWADLEGLITAGEISGRMLYRGEGRRPNTLLWAITLNGATLSRDMAQRVIPIRLDRPTYSATWEREVGDYIDGHRWDIFADCGDILAGAGYPITPRTRWATWEEQVLSRCVGVRACQDVILARQQEFDADGEETDTVRDHFFARIEGGRRDPVTDKVFIPTHVAAAWLNEASGTRHDVGRAVAALKNLGIPELVRNDRTRGPRGHRGFFWVGAGADPDAIAERLDLPDDASRAGRRDEFAWR